MKALALLSGGLDSTLAIKVLLEQGIEVEAINFTSPFCLCSGSKGNCHAATAAAGRLGVKLHYEKCGQDYLDMLAKPKYGYGRQINPCLDCRIFKLRRAKELMPEIGASFLVTGEVLDQRPMSQRRDTLDICERDTGLRGLILRPLSARVLRPTLPEERGWVDRSKLLAIRGRGRKPQIALAQSLGVTDYPCPGGGCLLTYEGFAAKVRDLLERGEGLNPWNVALLRVGRHFRLPGGTKLVVGKQRGRERTPGRSGQGRGRRPGKRLRAGPDRPGLRPADPGRPPGRRRRGGPVCRSAGGRERLVSLPAAGSGERRPRICRLSRCRPRRWRGG